MQNGRPIWEKNSVSAILSFSSCSKVVFPPHDLVLKHIFGTVFEAKILPLEAYKHQFCVGGVHKTELCWCCSIDARSEQDSCDNTIRSTQHHSKTCQHHPFLQVFWASHVDRGRHLLPFISVLNRSWDGTWNWPENENIDFAWEWCTKLMLAELLAPMRDERLMYFFVSMICHFPVYCMCFYSVYVFLVLLERYRYSSLTRS